MAGAFAMGAEGVQMGTRMLSCLESPVHDNWKQAVIQARGNRYRFSEPAGTACTESIAYRANRGSGAAGAV